MSQPLFRDAPCQECADILQHGTLPIRHWLSEIDGGSFIGSASCLKPPKWKQKEAEADPSERLFADAAGRSLIPPATGSFQVSFLSILPPSLLHIFPIAILFPYD